MAYSRQVSWKTRSVGVLALAVLAFAGAAKAEDASPWQGLGLSGTLRGSAFSHNFSFDRDAPAVSGSAWFTAEPARFRGVKTFVEGRVEIDDLHGRLRTSWELREGYVERSFGDVDLKVGRQIIVWGRADKVNPTDIWSVRDTRLLTTDNEDQRLGALAVQAEWRLSGVSLISIWQPEWRAPVFPIPPLPAGLMAGSAKPRDVTGQVGLKLDHSGSGIDWSLSYARAIDKIPDLRLEAPARLNLVYQRIEMLGADAAVPVGQYGLRGEVAYMRRLDRDQPGTFTKYDDLSLVAGIERTFGGEFNVNLQYLYHRNYGFRNPDDIPDPIRRTLAQQENVLSNQYARDMSGFSARLVDRLMNETLQLEIGGVTWFGRGGGTLGPKLTYAVNDRLQVIAGGQVYFGAKSGFLGGFHDASTAFVEARWGF